MEGAKRRRFAADIAGDSSRCRAMRAVYEGELLQCNAPIRAADHRFQDRMPTIRAISVRLAGIFNAPGLLPSLPSR